MHQRPGQHQQHPYSQQPPQQQPYGQPQQQWPPPPLAKKRTGKTVLIVGAVVLAMALIGALIQAIDGPDQTKPAAEASSANPTDQVKRTTKIPKPDAQQTEDLLYGLRQIDKELDRARSIDRARNTCWDLLKGKDRSQVVENTRLRFDGVAQIDTADARAIVKLIEDGGWCRT